MLVKVLLSKIKLATITKSSVRYEGSLGLDVAIMRELDLHPYQCVNVNSLDGSIRTETYLLPEKEGSGACVTRGALATILLKGDRIHLLAYGMMDSETAKTHKPIIIESNQ